jgi:hypothetical protein
MAVSLQHQRLIRNLYKQILWAGRSYPGGYKEVRDKAHQQFMAMKHETDPAKLAQSSRRFVQRVLQKQSMS